MYCIKCGEELEEKTKFCPSCGTQITQDDTLSKSTAIISKDTIYKVSATLSTSYKKISAIIGVILILLTFLPWLKLNIFFGLGEYTFFHTINMWVNAGGWDISYDLGWFGLVLTIFVIFWIISIALLLTFCFKVYKGEKVVLDGFLVMGIFSCLVIVGMYLADLYAVSFISEYYGVYSSGMFSTTPYPWIVAILSFATFGGYRYTEKRSNKKISI